MPCFFTLMHFACFCLPHFSAWVMRYGVPAAALVRHPLVVVEDGRVRAACRVAARAGVEPGMALARAQALLPAAVLCPRDTAREQAVWESVLSELWDCSPFLEDAAPGLAFAGLNLEEAGPFRALVAYRQAVAGVASSRALARLAALRAAPGNTLLIGAAHVGAFLHRCPVDLLASLAISADCLDRLVLFGYDTLGRVARLSQRHLKAQFGAEGVRLYQMLHPVGEPPVSLFQPPPSIAQSYAFDWPVSEPRELLPVLARLTASAAGALDQRCCGRVTLRLQQQGRVPSCTAARILPEGVCEARRLLQTARTLLLDLLSERREVEVITLELGALRVAEARQGTLFARRPAVEAAVRVVERKYPGSLKRIVLRPHALFEEDRVLLLPFLSDGVSPNGHADG